MKGKLSRPFVPNNRCVQAGKNIVGKIQNQYHVDVPEVKKKLPKSVVPGNVFVQASQPRAKLQVSAPPRRSKRLRKNAECIHDGISALNKESFILPKKKKKRYNVKRKKKVSSTLDVSQRAMRKRYKFWIVEVEKDSNSLFRAFAHQLYGEQNLHGFMRDRCCRYLELYREKFELTFDSDFNIGGFQQYLDGMMNCQGRGGNLEITAIQELYKRSVQIYAEYQLPQITISESVSNDRGLSQLRLMVNNDNYYNSIVTDDHENTVFVCDAGVFEDAQLFRHAMKVEHNFEIYPVKDDGNCLFSAISHQVYGDVCFHMLIRDRCCDYMKLLEGNFMHFIDTRRNVVNRRDENYVDFDDYLRKMKRPGIWGDNLEITALSELYQRPVEVYDQQTTPRATFSNSVNYDNDLPPIRISFKNGNHYDSVVSETHSETLLNIDEAGQFEDSVLASLRDYYQCYSGCFVDGVTLFVLEAKNLFEFLIYKLLISN